MAYTLGQYKRDVAAGTIKDPDAWTYKRVIDWQSKTRSSRAKSKKQVPYPGYVSQDGITADANRLTDQIISGAVAGISGMKPGITAEANRLAKQELEAGEGVAMALRPYAGDIQNIYTNAGNALSGAAQGFSSEIGSMLDADTNRNNQTLATLGLAPATTAQGGKVADVLYGQAYPASKNFLTAGRDYAAAAALQPGTAILQSQQYAGDRRRAGLDELTKVNEAIAKARGERPGTYQSVYDTLFTRDLKTKEFAAQRGNDAWAKYVDQQKLVQETQAAAAAASALGMKAQAEAFDQKFKIEQLKLDQYEAEARAQSYAPDPKIITGKDGSITRVNPDGSVVQLAPPGATGTPTSSTVKPPTSAQTQKWIQGAADLASTFFYGTVLNEDGKRILAKDAPGFDPSNADSYGQDALGYQQAFKRLKTRYPKLGSRKILALLNEHYDTPGSDGRPWFDMAERGKLRKLGFSQMQIRKAMRPEYRTADLTLKMLGVLGRPVPVAAAAPASARGFDPARAAAQTAAAALNGGY